MTTAIVERTITAFLDGDDSLEIGNIIHSTEGAARYGYSGPLVGGVTVYAWSVSALVEALGDEWLDLGWVEFQLRRPVYPGELITTQVSPLPPLGGNAKQPASLHPLGGDANQPAPLHPLGGNASQPASLHPPREDANQPASLHPPREDANQPTSLQPQGGDANRPVTLPPQGGDAEGRGGSPSVEFTMTKHSGDVAVRGTAGLGVADFYPEISVASDRTPRPRPDQRPFITRAVAPLGQDLAAMEIDLSIADAERYADEFARDPDPRWRGAGGRVHPAWIALRANNLLAHTWRYTAIHASSQIQHLAPIHPGQQVTVSGRIDSGYERKGHEYAVLDITLSSSDGRDLARMRQPTIYQLAER